jgi:alcohol-forming fatty acyl-CoA reductase
MGILIASSLGLSKTMYADPKNVMDMIPVDVCCKAMIVASWKRASEEK